MKLLAIYVTNEKKISDDATIYTKYYNIQFHEYNEIMYNMNNKDYSISLNYLKDMPDRYLKKLYPDIYSPTNNMTYKEKKLILYKLYLIYDNQDNELSNIQTYDSKL